MEINIRENRLDKITIFAQEFLHSPPTKVQLLKGDGSDRQIFHIHLSASLHNDMVGVIHENIRENDDFIFLSEEFKKLGFPVPSIISVSDDRTMYLQQYLGPDTLADKIGEWLLSGQQHKVVDAYKIVIQFLVKFQQPLSTGLESFLVNRTMDKTTYQKDLDYLKKSFLIPFGLDHLFTEQLEIELKKQILDKFSRLESNCFVYRDFQCRNVMWIQSAPWFIDYQSAFKGPFYYDLASLLYSSKSGLNNLMRDQLLSYYFEISEPFSDYQEFKEIFYRFVILRRLRSLGSYGFLSLVKKKTDFFPRIAPTLRQIKTVLENQPCLHAFTELPDFIDNLMTIWEGKHDEFSNELTIT